MKLPANLHLKTMILIVLMALFGPVGDVFLSKGMKQIGPLASWAPAAMFHFFFAAFTSGMVWLGILSLLAFFVSYTLVLSWADYSYVQPASSFAYAVVALLGHFALHETVTPLRWFGIAIICLGVLIVGHTPPRTTEVRSSLPEEEEDFEPALQVSSRAGASAAGEALAERSLEQV
jgi:drug/metabolite transporter (DMT)-like permease